MEKLLGPKLRRVAAHEGRAVELTVLSHGEVDGSGVLPPFDVVLVDAYRPWQDRRLDPLLPLFSGLWIARRAARWRPTPRIIGYSAGAHRPEVNIPFREIPGVLAVYDAFELVDHLPEVLWGERFEHEVRRPGPDDYRTLGVDPSAQIFLALDIARRNDEAWEVVARPHGYVPASVNVRRYFRDKVGPHLPLTEPGNYRALVRVLRQVAGFPDDPTGIRV